MDDQRFDRLTKQLSHAVTRRTAWQGGVAGLLGLAGLAATSVDGGAQITGQHCLPAGRVCKAANAKAKIPHGGSHNHRCGKCCSQYSVPAGRRGRKCACRPNGMRSQNQAQCCSGVRIDGRCGGGGGGGATASCASVCGAGVTCAAVAGVPPNPDGQANQTACTGGSPNACSSGYCVDTLCQPCPTPCATATGEQCCQDGSFCIDGACRVCAGVPAI